MRGGGAATAGDLTADPTTLGSISTRRDLHIAGPSGAAQTPPTGQNEPPRRLPGAQTTPPGEPEPPGAEEFGRDDYEPDPFGQRSGADDRLRRPGVPDRVLGRDSFFPPGKVADFWGFQYLRDNDPSEMGHNTDFLTRAATTCSYVLTDEPARRS